jgi:hypothetical protein
MKAMKISFENNKNSVNFAATLDDPQMHICHPHNFTCKIIRPPDKVTATFI